MRIDIAVYTAQEGYSWQPGTALGAQELREYKNVIGRFPSPDSGDFPFGGIFLKGDRVVFYRYHVAKRIDFRGRDALYCVLGVLPKAEATHVDPKALFALPEFAGVVRPFPTHADLVAAVPENVPEWLKNLDAMSLDVRISGTPGDMKFAVEQKPTKMPPLPRAVQPVPIPPAQPPALAGVKVQSSPSTGTGIPRPFTPPHALPRETKSWWRNPYLGMAVGIAIIAVMIIAAIVLTYFIDKSERKQPDAPIGGSPSAFQCGSASEENDSVTTNQMNESESLRENRKVHLVSTDTDSVQNTNSSSHSVCEIGDANDTPEKVEKEKIQGNIDKPRSEVDKPKSGDKLKSGKEVEKTSPSGTKKKGQGTIDQKTDQKTTPDSKPRGKK